MPALPRWRKPSRLAERPICGPRSLQACRKMLGVLLMALEDFQAGLQQRLKLPIIGRRNERLLERPIDGLVVASLVGRVRFIECGAGELFQLSSLVGLRPGDRLAG